ncbi:MAG: response regulator transcription factor [Paludibacteraceae bacterium]|nr:response regulator transcription factor [Paludibacteraceae bacterium]
MEMQVLNISIGEIIDLLIMLLGVAIVCIAAFSYRKQNFIRLQAAHQKIDELSERMAEQEAALLRQQHLYNIDKCLANIRAQHPAPEKTWTNYHSMLQDIDAQLNNWIASFESRTQLAEREVQFCTYLLVYPHLTLDEIAQHICYSEKSIRNYKQRIAHKLGVSSADLHQHLQNDVIAYLYNDNTNSKLSAL